MIIAKRLYKEMLEEIKLLQTTCDHLLKENDKLKTKIDRLKEDNKAERYVM